MSIYGGKGLIVTMVTVIASALVGADLAECGLNAFQAIPLFRNTSLMHFDIAF